MCNEYTNLPDGGDPARFEEVWQRVLPGLDPPPATLGPALQPDTGCLDTPTPELPVIDDGEFLRERIDRCCADARLYAVLAERCGRGCVSRTCRALARRKREQLRRLQTALYIQTGETYRGGPVCPYVYSALEILRQQCLTETENSQMYLDYADQTASPRVAALCRELAAEDTQCACLLERLVDSLLC